MPLSVRNRERNTTVFAKIVAGESIRVTWMPHGHYGDTQRVPNALKDDIDFLNTLEQGVLEVIDGPEEIVAELQFETEKQRRAREERAAAATESLDRRQDRDLVGAECIGPRGGNREGKCGRPLLIANRNINDVPPLCEEHEALAPTFFLVEEGSKGEGATHTRDGVIRREWKSAVIEQPRSTGR